METVFEKGAAAVSGMIRILFEKGGATGVSMKLRFFIAREVAAGLRKKCSWKENKYLLSERGGHTVGIY